MKNSENLSILNKNDRHVVSTIFESLRRDEVVLVKDANIAIADNLIREIAEKLGFLENLEIQAGYASVRGHRVSLGRYFMSVNRRDEHQFITPHSEGGRFSNMQLAAFFCYENSTDGGVTILMNVDSQSECWGGLKEAVVKIRAEGKILTPGEMAKLRVRYMVNYPYDVLDESDIILEEIRQDIEGVQLFKVLAKPKKTYSDILEKYLYVYWDNISSIDMDSAFEFEKLLRVEGLLKGNLDDFDIKKFDLVSRRRIWKSGVIFEKLFCRKIAIKLEPGDFIIMNNLTWTHSVSNWTAGSGKRSLAAAFA